MMTRTSSKRLLLVVALTATACNGSSDPENTEPSAPATTEQDGTLEAADDPSAAPTAADPEQTVDGSEPAAPATDVETPSTSEALRPGVVALDGSIEDVLRRLADAANFASGVSDWLAAVPGQEGVLRNSRGVTLFVPVDNGFPTVERDAAFADPDRSAMTIGDHLRVGVLETLEETVVVASGREYVVERVGGDTFIGGRRVLRSEATTNGVIHLIDGPLGGDQG